MEDSDILRLLEARQYDEAFAPLLERFKDKVFRLAFSMMRNETHAEDATQDVLVKIWNGLPSYHGGASLSTWIYAITRNTCLTELKRRYRHPLCPCKRRKWKTPPAGFQAPIRGP